MKNVNGKKVILLADDDSDDRELFCEALADRSEQVIIHVAENGKLALEKLETLSDKPDMIFLDINMPVMNGWQCLKTLKEDERYKNIPVIIYSSSSHQREKEVALDMGAVRFFTKPNDFYEFRDTLAEIVNA